MNRTSIWLAAVALAAALPLAGSAQDGTLDLGFFDDGVRTYGFDLDPDETDRGAALASQPDGKLLMAGSACGTADACHAGVIRMLENGNLDVPFSGGGVHFPYANGTVNGVTSILVRPNDGGIVVVGMTQPDKIGLAALDALGDLNPAFGDTINSPGTILHALAGGTLFQVNAALLQSDRRILVAGQGRQTGFTDLDFFVARFTEAGQYDGSYNTDGVAWVHFDLGGANQDALDGMALQADGKVVVGGNVDVAADDEDTGFARFTTTGALDPTFDGDSGTGNGKFVWDAPDDVGLGEELLRDMTVQPDGRILFVGSYYPNAVGANTAVFFGRLLTSGATDPALDVRIPDLMAAYDSEVAHYIVLQSDKKFVVGFEPIGGSRCGAARFDANGNSLDSGFGTAGVVSFSNFGNHAYCVDGILWAGKLTVVGQAQLNPSDVDFIGFRFNSALIFTDGFESGSTAQW